MKVSVEYVDESLYIGQEEKCIEGLYRQRREKVERLKLASHRYVSILAGCMLQELVENELGIKKDELNIIYGSNGKPSIEGCPDFHFNLSHSGKCVALVYGECSVGIDVEEVRSVERRVAQRCYSAEENEYVYSDEMLSSERFFEIWTMKESYLKYTGQGISIPLNTIRFDVPSLTAYERTGDDVWERLPVKFCMYKTDGYIVTVCTADSASDIELCQNRKCEKKL